VLIAIRTSPDAALQLRSLHDWLSRDARLGRGAKVRWQVADERPDTQGSAFDTINILLNDGVALAGLAISFATWHRTRRSSNSSDITFERAGVKLTVPATAEVSEDVVRLIKELGQSTEAYGDELGE